MGATPRIIEEVTMGDRCKARSRVECVNTCTTMPDCTRIWFNYTEALCYQLTLALIWTY